VERIITVDRITEGPVSTDRVIYYSIILNISGQTGCACNHEYFSPSYKGGGHLSTTVRGVLTCSSTELWDIHTQILMAVLQSGNK